MSIDNRGALIGAARRCIVEIGYAHTTARDVATTAGVSLGAIGYHFGSKEELLNEAIAEAFREWITAFASLIADAEVDKLDALVAEVIPKFFALIESNRPLLTAFVEALAQAEHSPALREQLALQYRQSRTSAMTMMTSVLGPQIADRGLDPLTLSSLILALADGLIIQCLLDPSNAPTTSQLANAYSALVDRPSEARSGQLKNPSSQLAHMEVTAPS